MTEKLIDIRKNLLKKLKKERFEHTIGVMYTAASLAMCYGEDIEKALTAGLLHDCGKFCPAKEQIRLCEKYAISLSESELAMPALIHAKLGAYLAENEYKIKDREILDAITWHTTGKPEMRLLDKILYIADYIEPGRNQAPNLPQARKLAFEDLDECLFLILRDTLAYLTASKAEIDPMTQQTYEYYKAEREKGGRQ